MKSEESESSIAEERMIPRTTVKQSNKEKQAFVTF